MGAFADAIARFAQPLVDATDGSPEKLQRAMLLSQICWTLAQLPTEQREAALAKLRPALHMDDSEFEDFQSNVVGPMIRRHREMFPGLSGEKPVPLAGAEVVSPPAGAPRRRVEEAYPGTGRNAPCPCGSGQKYKRCCGP